MLVNGTIQKKQKMKKRSNPKTVNPYDSKAYKRVKRVRIGSRALQRLKHVYHHGFK